MLVACLFFGLLLLVYQLANRLGAPKESSFALGGADVKLMFGILLVFEWQQALYGLLFGLSAAAVWLLLHGLMQHSRTGRHRPIRKLPLVPWIAGGSYASQLLFLILQKMPTQL